MKKNITIPVKYLSRKALAETLSALEGWKADTLAALTTEGIGFKEAQALSADYIDICLAIGACKNALNGVFRE